MIKVSKYIFAAINAEQPFKQVWNSSVNTPNIY